MSRPSRLLVDQLVFGRVHTTPAWRTGSSGPPSAVRRRGDLPLSRRRNQRERTDAGRSLDASATALGAGAARRHQGQHRRRQLDREDAEAGCRDRCAARRVVAAGRGRRPLFEDCRDADLVPKIVDGLHRMREYALHPARQPGSRTSRPELPAQCSQLSAGRPLTARTARIGWHDGPAQPVVIVLAYAVPDVV